ncbi:MAG: hypothetical protein ACREMW_02580 [Gemmatimonadales bacterium]
MNLAPETEHIENVVLGGGEAGNTSPGNWRVKAAPSSSSSGP